jgi:hypothetical protein
MPQVFYSSPLCKHLKMVKVKGFSPLQNIWLLHSRHIGRLAPAVDCVREAVIRQLRSKAKPFEIGQSAN